MADVSIDASVSIASCRGLRTAAWHRTDSTIGYKFFIDSDGTFCYRKTTDSGATWGSIVTVASATTHVAFDIWADWWTPGDTGTLIHLWYFDTTSSDVIWRTLDTASDTFASAVTAKALASALAVRGAFVSGTKTTTGYLYCAFDIDSGTERGLHRSTDSGATWSSNLSTTFVEATGDTCLLFPAANTGDGNDLWAMYLDTSTEEFTLKVWDSSAASASESASIISVSGLGTDGVTQTPISGSVRHSDGHLIVAACSRYNVSTGDHRVYDINGTGSITELTAIAIDKQYHYSPAVFIDQTNNYLYIAYRGKTDDTETLDASKVWYKRSTDNGATWSADTGCMESAAVKVRQVWAPLMGPRFWVNWLTWTAGDTVFTLTGNHGATIASSQQRPVVFVCT